MSKHKARQSQRIIHATLKLVEDEGFSALSMSKVAEVSGVTRQTIYNYFPDVDGIIAAAMEMHSAAMKQHVEQAIQAASGTFSKLQAFAAFYINAASREHSGAINEAILSPHARDQLTAHTNDIKAILCEIIAEGIRSGDVSAASDATVTADLVWNLVKGTAETAAQYSEEKVALLKAVTKAMRAVLL